MTPVLSILITSYNRPAALQKCVEAIREIDWPVSVEVVVSDDASTPEALSEIKQIKGIDHLLTAQKNLGLGGNLNKVLKAAKGEFVLYCQEDFLLEEKIAPVIAEAIKLIREHQLEMVRFQANYHFPKLVSLTTHIFAIPHFSWKNFLFNTFQYSDNPFITRNGFFKDLGYFLEGVRSDYGEAEFAIRVVAFKKRIGITKPYFVKPNEKEQSTLRNQKIGLKKTTPKKKLKRFLRALRQHVEWLFYRKNKRGLITYSKS